MLLVAAHGGAQSQTIYPLNRAEILVGAKFDLKVEFPNAPPAVALRVTINGEDAASITGKSAAVIEREDGGTHSAYWLRDVALPKPGRYVVEAAAGDSKASVTWDVFDTPARKAKNVILFIGDGMSVAHRTAARILSKGLVEGRYGGELAIDDMPHMALVSTSGTDSVVTDSANSMSAYTTGHKSCVNAMGVYCALNKSTLDHPKVETIAELVKRTRGMAVGVVTNTEIEDATPAGMVAHTRRRADYNDIVKMFFAVQPEVIMGGGSVYFRPASAPGGKRTDDDDYIKKFEGAGYAFVSTKTELNAAAQGDQAARPVQHRQYRRRARPLLPQEGHGRPISRPARSDRSGARRARYPVEERQGLRADGRVRPHRQVHPLARLGARGLRHDHARQRRQDGQGLRRRAQRHADHRRRRSRPSDAIIGTYDDSRPGQQLRDKLGLYQNSMVPNYPAPNADGYPDKVDVSRRLAFVFGGFPDYCDAGRPYLDGENVPAVRGPNNDFVANEKYCNVPGAARRAGNLPFNVGAGVHAADDVVLTAIGPGAEMFHGRIDNTRVFRNMVTALGLGSGPSQ